jgi:ABC-2 type transport system permease protein
MRNKVRSKSFIVMTLIFVILASVLGNLPYLIEKLGGEDQIHHIGYLQGQQPEIIQGLQAYYGNRENADIRLEHGASSEDELKRLLSDGKIKGYLTFADNPESGFPTVTYHSKNALGSAASQSLSAALQAVKIDMVAKDVGLTDEQKSRILAPVELRNQQVLSEDESGKSAEEQAATIGLAYVLVILLFMSIMISGQLIATEVTAEKSSRVMEIIVTSVSPLTQMFGKVIGTFIAAILQIALIVAALLINLNLPHNAGLLSGFGIDLGALDPLMMTYAVVFFLAGFFLYAMVFAAVGSIVSRTEELGQASMPITILSLAGFYIALFGLNAPDSPVVVISSYIPFFSPFIVVLREGLAAPAWWESVLSLGILVASILVLGWVSAKIYRTGVLMYGKRPTVKELIKAMKAYKL